MVHATGPSSDQQNILRIVIFGTKSPEVMTAAELAKARGADVAITDTMSELMRSLRQGEGVDAILVDVHYPISELFTTLRQERFYVPVIAFGIDTDAKRAADAIRLGAREFLPLPPEPDLIAAILESISIEKDELVYRDPVMENTIQLARKFAPAQANILVTGESGTGKEMMARFLHRNSSRAANRFVTLNCAAIPDNLLESELFGHEKGAFSGAVARRIGKFEQADGGTLFLDEISEMDVRLQAKLLRAIQEREIDRLGGTKPVKVDIRIVATSNRNLQQAVTDGTFREDLLFRLNVLTIDIPPLRERPGDVAALSHYFVDKLCQANGLQSKEISADALTLLQAAPWRGNVRELENCIHRAILIADEPVIDGETLRLAGTIGQSSSASLQPATASLDRADGNTKPRDGEHQHDMGGSPVQVGKTVAEVERELILETLDQLSGNRTHAAQILGISIRTLRNKLKQYAEDGHEVVGPNFEPV